MTVSDEKGHGGSNKQNAGSTTGRIGDDVQRAKENISDAAASARDDIAADCAAERRRHKLEGYGCRARQDRVGGGRRSGERHRPGHRIGSEGPSKHPAFRIRGRRTAQSAGRRHWRIRNWHTHRYNERPPLMVATLLRLVGIDIKRLVRKPRSPSCSPCSARWRRYWRSPSASSHSISGSNPSSASSRRSAFSAERQHC